MAQLVVALLAVLAAVYPAQALDLIEGSIGYGHEHVTRLQNAPVGSLVTHEFQDKLGKEVHETYKVQEDGTLKLETRQYHDK